MGNKASKPYLFILSKCQIITLMYINDNTKKNTEQDFINAWSLQEAAFISLSKQRTFFILPFQWAAVIHDTLPNKSVNFITIRC